jgi:hypothetical protein
MSRAGIPGSDTRLNATADAYRPVFLGNLGRLNNPKSHLFTIAEPQAGQLGACSCVGAISFDLLSRRSPREHRAYFRGNLRKRERFGDEVPSSIHLPTVNDRTARKTTCIQDLDIRLP